MNINEIFNRVPYEIFDRGEDYYNNDYILSLEYDDVKNIIESKVEGSGFRPYSVKVSILNDEILDYYCNCPYDYGDICKHLIAVFLAIANKDHLKALKGKNNENYSGYNLYSHEERDDFEFKKGSSSKSEDSNHVKLLQSASKKELIDFILEYSKRDKQLKYELSKRFNIDNVFDISEIKRFIKNSTKNNYYGDYLDEDDSSYVASEFEEILDNYDGLLDKTNCNIIFNNTFEILIESADILDKSIGDWDFMDFEDIISHAKGLLHHTACYLEKYGADDEKNNAFCTLIRKGLYKKFNYIDNIYFFEIASIFVNKDNKEYFFEKFDEFKEDPQNRYIITYSSVKSIERDIIEKLEGGDAAYKYMINNIDNDSFAFTIVDQAIESKDFTSAEEICLSKIKRIDEDFPNSNFNHQLKKWYEYLYKIYRLSKEKEKEIDIVYKLLKNGNHEYYSVLKSLYKIEGIWDEKYKSVIEFTCENLSSKDYMSILATEKEWKLLFEEVKSAPSNVFIYGKVLATICPDKTFKIYTDIILSESSIADTRTKYRKVCKLIKKLYDDGGHKPTADIIKYLKETYKNRPAFQDEIDKLKRRLSI